MHKMQGTTKCIEDDLFLMENWVILGMNKPNIKHWYAMDYEKALARVKADLGEGVMNQMEGLTSDPQELIGAIRAYMASPEYRAVALPDNMCAQAYF